MASDAWGIQQQEGANSADQETTKNSFEDNFSNGQATAASLSFATDKKEKEQQPPCSSASYQPLPDSQEYLQSLEAKLKKVQSSSISKALAERRSDEARRLLDSKVQNLCVDNELLDDVQVADNPLLRKVFPEKQAVSQSELQKLVPDKKEEKESGDVTPSKEELENAKASDVIAKDDGKTDEPENNVE